MNIGLNIPFEVVLLYCYKHNFNCVQLITYSVEGVGGRYEFWKACENVHTPLPQTPDNASTPPSRSRAHHPQTSCASTTPNAFLRAIVCLSILPYKLNSVRTTIFARALIAPSQTRRCLPEHLPALPATAFSKSPRPQRYCDRCDRTSRQQRQYNQCDAQTQR